MASRRRLNERFAFASHAVHHHHHRRRRPLLESLEGRVVLSTFTVNSLADAGTGSNDTGDLRYCINQANADDQANTIVFDPTVFGTAQTITLGGGQLELSDTAGPQTITGPAAGLTISGGGSSRVFQVDGGVTASFSGLTITGGNGGGLANDGTATLTDCTISGNVASNGGGVLNSGAATLIGCTISNNTAYYPSSYLVYGYYGSYVRSIDKGSGGGVDNSGTATLTGCTISGNNAVDAGGGVLNNDNAHLTMSDCTLSGNVGGVSNSGAANLTACTVSGNSGGGLVNASGAMSLTDTIVAGNSGDIEGGTPVTGSNNLIGTTGSGGLVDGVNGNIVLTSLASLDLTPLGNYGGPTQTMALTAGSPAIGAGAIADYPGTSTEITTDQRGLPLDSPNPDIGAFQSQGTPLIEPTFSVSNQSIIYGAPSVTIFGTLTGDAQAPVGETVDVTLNGALQSAAIGTGGAFSTTFATTGLTVPDSPYTITYAYEYTSGEPFASASASSTLSINPTLITLTVDGLGDAGVGSGDSGDLRYCINQANTDDQSNAIVFDPTVFATPQTITLSGGTLELENPYGTQTITGPAAGLTISGGGSTRVLQVDSRVTASLSDLTISGGSVIDANGGGLANYGTTTLTDCTLSGNSVSDTSNPYSPAANGGAVYNSGAANLTLTDCTLSGNSAPGGGGGVDNAGTANLTGCTLSADDATHGGGVSNLGTATLIDCTLSGNTAGYNGGGLANYSGSATATLVNCTVSGNTSTSFQTIYGIYSGGMSSRYAPISGWNAGVYNLDGTVNLTDTIVAGNTNPVGASDVGGDVSGSYNLIGTGGSGGLVNGVDGNIVLASPTGLGLAPLGNNGGPTQTIALLPDSPAIGAGLVADFPGTTTPIATDQRGLPLDTPDPDIGAFQTQGSSLIRLTFTGISDQSITFGTSSVVVSGTLSSDSQAPVGESVAVTLDGAVQSATIGTGGAFTTTLATTGLTVLGSPYTITCTYASDGTFAFVSTSSSLTITPAALTTFTVNSLGDSGTGSGETGDLRYCINQANADDGANTIVFDPTVFATPQTITLGGNPLELSDSGGTQTITGPAAGLTISGGGSSPVFQVDSGVTASISGLTISDGSGGGLANDGTATLTDCTVSDNTSVNGAGVHNGSGANLTLADCTISGNIAVEQRFAYAVGTGGGVTNDGEATLTDCTLSDNTSVNGGGVYNGFGATLTLTDCTVSANVAVSDVGSGGGIMNSGMATLINCTFSGNDAAYNGGGVYNSGSANLIACTISDNSATGVGGGLYSDSYGEMLSATDTIVAGNTSSSGASDIGGNGSVAGNNNLIGTGGSGGLANGVDGNIVGVASPLLSTLGNNGGPTDTMALLAGSPALGAGVIADDPGTTTPITTDQRGLPLDSPSPDIGAFQNQGTPLIEPTFSVSDQSITYGAPSVTISGTLADGTQVPVGETVTVSLNGALQTATIGPGGAFSTTFDTTALTVPDSPYTITYEYTTDGILAGASATSKLTVNPILITLTVDSLGDAGIGSGDSGDLRYCIDQANTDGQSNQIVFDPTVFAAPQTITLSGGTLVLENIWGTQTITGPAVGLIIAGGGSSLVLQVDSGVNASISGLTVSQGDGVGLSNDGTTTLTNCTLSGINGSYGIGMYNAGTANISDCTISGNLGGGLANIGSATLSGCTISNNDGGLLNRSEPGGNTADLVLINCNVSDNGGPGVVNSALLSLTNCTISSNSGDSGGGLAGYGGGNSAGGLVNDGGLATLTGCTLSGNSGGGVSNTANLTMSDCTLSGNSATSGGGLYNRGSATLTDCTFSGNVATSGVGGAVDNRQSAQSQYGYSFGNTSGTTDLSLTDCTASGNSATSGGGLYNSASATLTDCTFSGNVATSGVGGAVDNSQSGQSGYGYIFGNPSGTTDLSLTDCTLSGNSATSGGGVYNSGSANLIACTVSSNYGGGLLNTSGAMGLTDTIVAGNTDASGASDITGKSLVTGGNNLIGTGGSGGLVGGVDGNIVGVADPLLAPLGNYGGPTDTMALLTGSPAIGAGTVVAGVTADERGLPLDSPNPDIGAFQTQPVSLVAPTFSVSNQSITYGTSDVTISGTLADGSQAPAGETVAITLNGQEQSAIIGPGGTFSMTFDTPGLTVTGSGSPDTVTYAYTSDGTFASATASSSLTVTPATLTITADPETKVYGTADPVLAYAATGFQFDDTAATVLTGSLARTESGTLAGEQVGMFTISQGTLAADSNYTIAFTGDTLTITPATLTVTANAQTKVYGTEDPALTDTATGLVNTTVDGVAIDDTAASALTGSLARAQAGTLAGEQVGGYAIGQGTLAVATGDYTMAFTGSTLTVTPATLTVRAMSQSKVYGTADPSLTDTAAGFIDTTVDGVTIDDTAASVLTGHLARAAGETVAGGPYAITPGTLAAGSNYTISFTGNTLTITPAALTIAAEPETKVFGSPDPTLAYTASGFQFADTAATVLTGSLARSAGETVAGGPYAIDQGTLTAGSNYTIQFTGSSLTITPATPTVTVTDPGGTYSGAPIAAIATVTGIGGTAASSLEGAAPTVTYYAGSDTSGTDLGSAAPSAPGTYTVVASFPGSADYVAAESQPATFVIAPAAATIVLTSSSSSTVYGQAITFVATVNSAAGPTPGTVTFSDGTTPLATVPLDGSGEATLSISTLSPGSHAITATYNGGTNFLAGTSGMTAESISQSATAIDMVPQSVLVGKKTVVLTAEIGPVISGGVAPTGQVRFEFVTKHGKKVMVKNLGTAELAGGKATLRVKLNQVLKKPLTIVYSGDSDFLPSTTTLPELSVSTIARSRT